MKKNTVFVVLAALVLAALLTGCVPPVPAPVPAPQQPPSAEVVWQLVTDRDYVGPIQRGAVSGARPEVILATMATLYGVEGGNVEAIAERPEEEARLILAPGGEVYAWLIPSPDWHGLFSVRLHAVSSADTAELRLPEFPYGFSALYLGFQGKLIVTASPLDDWEGLRGRFQYTFWGRQGETLNTLILPGRQLGFLDPGGTSILLLGEEEATALSASGEVLWQVKGSFRKSAIAASGWLALLNPAPLEAINQVVIYTGSGQATTVEVPTPVHDLVVVPDGSLAVVVGDQGRYFYLDMTTAELREGSSLPLEGTHYIFDAEFVDADTLAFGVLHRVGEPPQYTWPDGSIIVIDRDGNVAFQKRFPIREPIASVPAVDVIFGDRSFVGFTQDTTIFVDLGQ